jgi:hypothetical protein
MCTRKELNQYMRPRRLGWRADRKLRQSFRYSDRGLTFKKVRVAYLINVIKTECTSLVPPTVNFRGGIK